MLLITDFPYNYRKSIQDLIEYNTSLTLSRFNYLSPVEYISMVNTYLEIMSNLTDQGILHHAFYRFQFNLQWITNTKN